MLEKTRAIVLHQVKYTDSGIIAQLYTRKFGRQSFIVRGLRNKKAGKHSILFQPMFILDLEMYYRHTREVQSLKEFAVAFTPYNVFTDIRKSCVAIFLGEVLTSVLREESPHEELFDFLEEAIKWFDASKEDFANFHIGFLAGLSSYLGFEPGRKNSSEEAYFDMMNGGFVMVPPLHGIYAGTEISEVLAKVFSSSYETIGSIPLNGRLRNEILDTLIRYYSLHLPGLKRFNSLEVLKEVFSF
ncbi:MAG: DNA repair protein RecO [Bacteroidales bacterium]|jgi:DNA repair protein RecO (recombination protein O)|nr:DNA repair protein RecO [Bacteroidales bacterium]MCU0409399.1 DNA repair protein RecO [Bacteroidales bacterium]